MNEDKIIITGPGEYVTNTGLKFSVVAPWPCRSFPWIGHWSGGFEPHHVNAKGNKICAPLMEPTEYITGPWIEKPVIDWDSMPAWANAVCWSFSRAQWLYTNGSPFPASNGPHYWRANLLSDGSIAVWSEIPEAYAPPAWKGDWRESLVIRPGYEEAK